MPRRCPGIWRTIAVLPSADHPVFPVFQLLVLRLPKRQLLKIAVGLIYTYVGLVLFLTGANVGFMPAGNYLGQVLASFRYPWILVPIAMIMGYFIVKAEPAVYVLNKQVEEMTDGAISETAMGHALSPSASPSRWACRCSGS